MYHMKTLVAIEDKIVLPKCMFYVKNPNKYIESDEVEINITEQGVPSNNMIELEKRQDQLLRKLDVLYDRIKALSRVDLKQNSVQSKMNNTLIPEEVVLVLNHDMTPHFLNLFLKYVGAINITWHIHSSMSKENSTKIKDFFKHYQNIYVTEPNAKINLRLIFKCVSASAELKISSLDVPILGIVNILRYLCLAYQNIVPYDHNNYFVDGLLDICYLLEKTKGKIREDLIKKLFSQCETWIYGNSFSIVDLAAYIVIKKENLFKSVPKVWLINCEKMLI